MGGLATYGKQQALIGILPKGTNFYAGYLTTLPTDDAGTALVEASGSGYARILHTDWIDHKDSDSAWWRVNNGAIEFAVLTADLEDIVGWGIWTDVAAGSLVAWGSLLDAQGVAVIRTFKDGGQPRFIGQELRVGMD